MTAVALPSVSGRLAHSPGLDGLRGIAVMIVLASHFSSGGFLPQPGLHGIGKSGVYLFFVLSAFLLTHNLLYRPAGQLRQPRLWLDYAARRVLRIWPLYLLVLVLSWLAHVWALPGLYGLDSSAFFRHLSLQEGRSVLWSIPVEFTFYLWLPLIVIVLRWFSSSTAGISARCVILIVMGCLFLYFWPPDLTIENDVRLGPYLIVFIFGVLAAVLGPALAAMSAKRVGMCLGWLAIVLILSWCMSIPAIWCWLQGQPFQAAINRNWFIFFGLVWSGLLLAVLYGPAWLRAVAGHWSLVWVGKISFSLYLWHMPVIWLYRAWLDGAAPPPGALVWVGACCLLVAWVSYRLIELPLSRWRWPSNMTKA